jgi:nucleoid-associated protein EbfC
MTPENQEPDEAEVVLPDLTGAGGGGLNDLLASAQEAMSAQRAATEQVVEGTAGGEMVKVSMTGGGEVTRVAIAPEVVDPDDIEMLEDLIVAALADAGAKVTELQRAALGAFGQIDMGGLLGGGSGPAGPQL